MSDSGVVASDRASWVSGRSDAWTRTYVRQVLIADFAVAAVAAVVAVGIRFGSHPSTRYLMLSLALPMLWLVAVRVVGGYEMRFLGTGSDEFRKVLNVGVRLAAALVLISYAVNNELSRVYLVISMPVIVMLDLLIGFALRKGLHRRRGSGQCMSTVMTVGHEPAVAQLINELRREPYHGLEVAAACLVGEFTGSGIAGVPVVGDLDATADIGAGTVAELSCPEMDAGKLRTLAWELEETGTDLCVAPALLINVLLCEMSLVGPRPALPDETDRYADHVRRRLVVKPGLTGLRQVSGRSRLTWEETVRLGLRYVENWSLALDLQILWKAAAAMLRGSGLDSCALRLIRLPGGESK